MSGFFLCMLMLQKPSYFFYFYFLRQSLKYLRLALGMTLNSESSCPHFLCAGVLGVFNHTQFVPSEDEPRATSMLGKHSFYLPGHGPLSCHLPFLIGDEGGKATQNGLRMACVSGSPGGLWKRSGGRLG